MSLFLPFWTLWVASEECGEDRAEACAAWHSPWQQRGLREGPLRKTTEARWANLWHPRAALQFGNSLIFFFWEGRGGDLVANVTALWILIYSAPILHRFGKSCIVPKKPSTYLANLTDNCPPPPLPPAPRWSPTTATWLSAKYALFNQKFLQELSLRWQWPCACTRKKKKNSNPHKSIAPASWSEANAIFLRNRQFRVDVPALAPVVSASSFAKSGSSRHLTKLYWCTTLHTSWPQEEKSTQWQQS